MKTRFEKALMKLYTAFHEGTLNPFKCTSCAVGSLVGHGEWDGYSSFDLYYNEFKKDSFCLDNYPTDTDYSTSQLREVEFRFLSIWNGKANNLYIKDKDLQFKGLCEVVKYLAELDGVENPMEIMHLFKNKELVL